MRAYSDGTVEAIEKAEFVIEHIGYELAIIINYQELEKIEYYCEKNKLSIINIEYGEKIKCNIEVTKEEKDKIVELKEEGTLKIEDYKIIKDKNIRKNIEI